uniref:DUF308 domain-containing protein n=1 Tax=Prevotella sp. TaxID=59823 RepID=UPI004025C3B4
MKTFPKSILRSCCAIAAGVVLVQYREQAVMWITVGIGVVFFISAVISFIDYMASRKNRDEQVELFDAQGRKMRQQRKRSFPVVAVGCGILGSVMALSPNTFVGGLMFVLAALLIAGGAYQLFSLSLATRFARVGFVWWVLPVVILLIGLLALIKPSVIASAPLLIIGWCMMVYGVVDLVNALKIHRCKKQFDKAEEVSSVRGDAEQGQEDATEQANDNVSEDNPTA